MSTINNNEIRIKILHKKEILFSKQYPITCKTILSNDKEFHRNNDVCKKCILLIKHIIKDISALKKNSLKIHEYDQLFQIVDVEILNEISDVVLVNRSFAIEIFKDPITISSIKEQEKIIRKFHDHPLTGGHTEIRRTCAKILEQYKWPKLRSMVHTTYTKNCQACQLSKKKPSHKENQVLVPTPAEPFHTVQIDTYQASNPSLDCSSRNAVTIQCELTKYIVVVPVKSKSAEDVAKAIVDHFILIYGNFKVVKTDLGVEYINSVFKKLQALLQFEHTTSTPYHHESLGTVERNHRELNTYLRNYLSSDSYKDWVEWAKTFAFFYNNSVCGTWLHAI